MTLKIALELGSSYTSIFLDGNGIVYREPTCVAFVDSVKSRNCIAIGCEAKKMLGRSPEKTIVINPVERGIVTDESAATFMLRNMLKIMMPPTVLQPRINALVLIPCGLTLPERKMIEDVCLRAGITEVTLLESILAAAVGCEMAVESPDGCFIVNIGGGTTDVAAIAIGGIVNGCTVETGGVDMDAAVAEYVLNKYRIQIGYATAERIKEEIGSLFCNDMAAMSASGQDIASKIPNSSTVHANDVMEAVLPMFHKIADRIEAVVNVCPPETAANIFKTGIILTGACAKMPGLEQLFNARLKITNYVAPDPEYAVIVGGGKLIHDDALLEQLLQQN